MDNADGSSTKVARNALLVAASLALAGSILGVAASERGTVTGVEVALVYVGGVFAVGLLLTLFVFRRVPVQSAATVSTAFYTSYLCAGLLIWRFATSDFSNLCIYMMWFFPLLVFNRMVNSPAIGRFLAHFIRFAPLVLLACFFPRLMAALSFGHFNVVMVFCLSYICFGLMSNAESRYREAYIRERERAESLRIESEVLESISDCFISLDAEFRLVYLNDAACAEFGVKRNMALQATIPNAVLGFFSAPMLAALWDAAAKPAASMFEAQCESRGEWYEMRCFPRPDGMSVYFRNRTEAVLSRHKLEVALQELREQSDLLDKAQDAIFLQDLQSRILYWNKGAERLFGWTAEDVMGRKVADIFDQDAAGVKHAFNSVVKQGEWTGEISKRHRNGTRLIVESRCTLLRDEAGNPRAIMAINTDITDRKAGEARVHQLAFYDVLTGLPNRVRLRDRLEATLVTAKLKQNMSALLLIDLDDFRTLNDSSGHAIGDMLLQQVAQRLTTLAQTSDSVARLGGDEFVVLLEGLAADALTAEAQAKTVGQEVVRALREPYNLGGYEYEGTASIGVNLVTGNCVLADDLLKRADLALYRAKAQGKNSICFFDPGMETRVASRVALKSDLKRALQYREFELHYQPQVDTNGQVTGAEALLRWRHPQRGMVPPNEFIPLAEEAGLIVELGYWVLETACAQLAVWNRRPDMEQLTIAVNVSLRQFLDSHFVALVEKALTETQVNPKRLKLEITESFLMEKATDTIAQMTALQSHGLGFSMDDFGTGYSSLSQLKRLPLNQLKIDRSFVCDVLTGVMDASIVRTIIALGRSLNLEVIAEGVETEGQRALLQELGCYAYQGYLYSPALPAVKFEAFVEKTTRKIFDVA